MADKKYVECETALKIIDNYAKTVDESGAVVVKAIKDIVEIICPAADVVEVRHGEWKDNHCTLCGMTPIGEELWKHLNIDPPRFEFCMPFCPTCGARMDGERKESV